MSDMDEVKRMCARADRAKKTLHKLPIERDGELPKINVDFQIQRTPQVP